MSKPVFFDCEEILMLAEGLFTTPRRINLGDVIIAKPAMVSNEACTQIRLRDYIPNSFVWMSIRGDFQTFKQRMDAALSGQPFDPSLTPIR